MKIVIFNHSFFPLSETFIYRQVKGLPGDVDATLISYDFTNERLFPTSNPHIELKRTANLADDVINRLSPVKKKLGLTLFNYFRMKRLLTRIKPDAIHAHFGFNARDVFPLVRLLKIPLIISFHGVDASPEMLKNSGYRSMVARMVGYATAVIIVSPHMTGTLCLQDQQGKAHLIPYGVDTTEFTRQAGLASKAFVTLLHSGRLVSKKGVPDLVRVFISLSRKFNNIKLVVIGNGPELDACQTLARGQNANIEFLGAQPQEIVKKHMSQADIFVLNSRTSDSGDMEGLPNSILEAMSMELPVVSTRHAGIPQAIDDGANGMLVNERDNAALEEKLELLISDEALRIRLGEQARRTVENKFTINGMNNKITEVYRSVSRSLA